MLTITYKQTADLIPYATNSRTHSEDQINQIAASIKEFGFTNPVLLKDNTIVAGHGRCLAAQKIGLTTVPTINLDGLTDLQVKAYVIADNKLALNAGWDYEVLNVEIEQLSEAGFNIDLIGFSADELQEMKPESIDNDDEDDGGDVELNEIESIAKPGDIWLLGAHRLMCADSSSIDAIDSLMNNTNAALVMTDPPYSIETEGGCKGKIGQGLKKQGKAIDFISNFEPNEFLNTLPNLFAKGVFNAYIFCNKELLPDYLVWARDNKISFNVLVWKKPNALPIGGSHKPDIEYLLLFRKAATWNGALKGVNYSRLIECARDTGLHPTMKPVPILTNQILISSNKGDVVVDLFGGSGSTLIACEKTGRVCHMMEALPGYIDVTIKRWQKITDKEAILESTGQPFNSIT